MTCNTSFLKLIVLSLLAFLPLQRAAAQDNAAAEAPAPAAAEPAAPAEGAPASPAQRALLPGDKGSTEDTHAFGVLPNYRTVEGAQPYIPVTTKQKFTIATRDSLDGPSYALAAAFSSLSQLTNQNPSFGQGFKGYLHRYGTALIDQDLGNYMTEAIVPTLLRQDPRYFRKGTGGVWGRTYYAASRVFVAHTDTGKVTFNTSEVLGNGIAAAVGNWYYPDGRGFSNTMARMWQQIGTDAVAQILKEFWPDTKTWWQHRQERKAAAKAANSGL